MIDANRIPCQVLHCRRTLRNDHRFNQWLCDRHWQAIPRTRRAAYLRRRRRGWDYGCARLWRSLVNFARERAAGIR